MSFLFESFRLLCTKCDIKDCFMATNPTWHSNENDEKEILQFFWAVSNFDVVSWDGKWKMTKCFLKNYELVASSVYTYCLTLLLRWLNFPRVSFTAYHNIVIEIWWIAFLFVWQIKFSPLVVFHPAKVNIKKMQKIKNSLKAIKTSDKLIKFLFVALGIGMRVGMRDDWRMFTNNFYCVFHYWSDPFSVLSISPVISRCP